MGMIAYGVPMRRHADGDIRWVVFVPTGVDYRIFGKMRGRIDKQSFEKDPYEAIKYVIGHRYDYVLFQCDLSTAEIKLHKNNEKWLLENLPKRLKEAKKHD